MLTRALSTECGERIDESEIENIKGRTWSGESLWILAVMRNRERRQKLEGEGSSRKNF